MQNHRAHIILDKELRRDIDAIIQTLKKDTGEFSFGVQDGSSYRRSRERSIVVTKLQEAVMWLGMDLKAIREETPEPTPDGPEGQEFAAGFALGKAGMPHPDLATQRARDGHAAGVAARSPYPNSKDPSNTVIEPTADGLKL